MSTTIQLRRGTAAEWVTANPILAEGEMGVETDTGKAKLGDGVTAWNDLPYSVAPFDDDGTIPDARIPATITRDSELTAAVTAAVNALLDGAPGALNTLNELAAAINDDASFAATITTALAGKQPLDSDLTAIAALTTSSFGRARLTDADAAAARTALDAQQAGTSVALSTVTAANQLIVSSGSGAVAPLDVAASTFVGRKASGGVAALTVAEAKTLLAMTAADVSAVPLTGASSVSFTAANSDVLHVSVQNGLDGPALQLLSQTSAKAASMLLVPHASASESGNTSQILMYGKSGTDYNRFGISNNNGAVVIDSTYNGSGAARPVVIQMGGSVGNSITSQTAIKVWTDAGLDLIGSTNFTAGGRSGWCANFATRIADIANTGTSRLVIDTRTTTPTSNTADAALVEFRRGGTSKWLFGLNANGGNVDSFDFVAGSVVGLSVLAAGGLKIRSDSTSGNAALDITNTAASGHRWVIGEINAVGRLAFRDLTASGAPVLIEFDGTAKAVRLNDPCDLILGTSTGTKIGTATGQKIAFHNATPVAQRAGAAQVAVATTSATQTTPWGFTTQAQADAIVTLLNELRAADVEKGLIKGAA